MNCASLLHMLNPRPGDPSPTVPVDMAVRICLASPPPLRSLLNSNCSSSALLKHCERPRPCLLPGRCSDGATTSVAQTTASNLTATEDNCQPQWKRVKTKKKKKKKKKKSVVFADSRGLALTTVHFFNEFQEDPLSDLQFDLSEIEGVTAGSHLDDNRDSRDCRSYLVLDFTPPAADYLDLRNRLKSQQVCLETCCVQEHLLSGTVQVRNMCFEKSVSVRITFDSWSSFQDVECQYLNNIYGCSDTDTFSFSVSLPERLEPASRVEFCIQYCAQQNTFWDNNHGNNYQLRVEAPNGSGIQSSEVPALLELQRACSVDVREEMDLDPFGSPRTSAGVFPEWHSWGRVEISAPYW